MGSPLAAFSQWFGDPPMLQNLMGVKGAHLPAESVCKGQPYILNVHPFKDVHECPFLFSPSFVQAISFTFKCLQVLS